MEIRLSTVKMKINSMWKIVFLTTVLHLCHGQSFRCTPPYTCESLRDCVESVSSPEERIFWRCSDSEDVKVCCPPPDTPTREMLLTHPNFFLLNNQCGRYSVPDRITNGQEASIGEFPWMALLGYEGEVPGTIIFSCGGTIINKRYILTAAHCIFIQGLTLKTVRLGEFNVTSDPDCTDYCADPVVERGVEKIITHQQYNNPFRKNDIALLRVDSDIPFTDYIGPICLPFQNETSSETSVKYSIAGWGKLDPYDSKGSSVLQFATVSITPIEECSPFQSQEVRPLSKITQMCAGGLGPDACNGDSGGPLMKIFNNSKPTQQIGIVSFRTGRECGPTASVYTRLEGYLQWILDNIEL